MKTVTEYRELLNKAGITERKIARIEKSLVEAQSEHKSNLEAIKEAFTQGESAE